MFLILKGGTGVCICLESIINSTTKEYTTEWEAIAYKTTKCLSRGELRFSAPHLMPEARTAAYSGGAPELPTCIQSRQTLQRRQSSNFFYKCSHNVIFQLHQYQIIPMLPNCHSESVLTNIACSPADISCFEKR